MNKKIIVLPLLALSLLSCGDISYPPQYYFKSSGSSESNDSVSSSKIDSSSADSSVTLASAETIRYFNENANLDLALGQKVDADEPLAGFDRFEGSSGFLLATADKMTAYYCAGYPDAQDDLSVIGFVTSDPKYVLFGRSVGGQSSLFDKALADAGLPLPGLSIDRFVCDDLVVTISVKLETTDTVAYFLI